jgi:uncharacterized protein
MPRPPHPPRPNQRSSKRPPSAPSQPTGPSRSPSNPRFAGSDPDSVDPRWLLNALGLLLLLALACGYLTLCALFYQGQWQLVLHPTRAASAPSTLAGAALQTIHFGIDESATPQLTGWWLPAAPGSRYAASTVLYLPSGDGSLAQSAPSAILAALHAAGINIFAFDYRGYGQSSATHPNQQRMQQDAASAWQYLTTSRALAPTQIVIYGTGVGAALATQLAAQHAQIPALILQNPRPNLLDQVRSDARTRLLPVRLLFHDRFEIAPTLATLTTPKLLIASAASEDQAATGLYRSAADPKFTLFLPPSPEAGTLTQTLIRFFDQYLATAPAAADTKSPTAPPLPKR